MTTPVFRATRLLVHLTAIVEPRVQPRPLFAFYDMQYVRYK